MILFENHFDVVWSESILRVRMREEWNANDLQVGFGFGETWFIHLERVDVVRILDIIVNDKHVRLL